MLRKSGIILVLLITVTALVMASASAASANKEHPAIKVKPGDGGYYVVPATPDSDDLSSISSYMFTTSGVNYIVQGQTNWHNKYVSSSDGFYTDVNWGNSANSLQLRVYTPDGYALGPFYDGSDGRIDGRIYLLIRRPGGVATGTYYGQVFGYSVQGAQSYTFN